MKLRIRTECQQFSIVDDEMGADTKPVHKVEPIASQTHSKPIIEPGKFDCCSNLHVFGMHVLGKAGTLCTLAFQFRTEYSSHDAMEPIEGAVIF